MKHHLSAHAVHIDFLRLRCGSEERFANGLRDVRQQSAETIHTFISFSEWDAVVVVPCPSLYPRTLTEIYANSSVAASVSGTSGYFAYLWEHPINEGWQENLIRFERSGPTVLMSLRFADWFRHDVGVGAEILFCNHLKRLLDRLKSVQAIVAHSLGWNDVVIMMHAEAEEAKLTDAISAIRLTTLQDCLGSETAQPSEFSQQPTAQIFAASYTHLLGGFDAYMASELSFGRLASQIASGRILVRVAPPYERRVRTFLSRQLSRSGIHTVPSEMGHYSLSMDISTLIVGKKDEGKRALTFIAKVRAFIGSLTDGEPDSYAETTTIFRFDEPKNDQARRQVTPMSNDLKAEIDSITDVMKGLPHQLLHLGVSAMTSHRFVSVLTTLLDHLSDPVRSSVVRHLSRFARTIPDVIRDLDTDGVDDLCHVLEYAVGQAIDGIAQFQHDANALGLSGRGGYSRLIVAVEWYIRGTFARLGMGSRLPLITFGLRSGNAGSAGRYQIDIPFNVLFVPGRWHILFHEVGHLAWISTFGWMMESLTIYRAMEREISLEVPNDLNKTGKDPKIAKKERAHVEFLRAREIVRELFPNYLMFALPCAGDIEELDKVALRRMLSMRHPSSVTRELLLRVVTHCLIVIMRDAMKEGGVADPRRSGSDSERARDWWSIWDHLTSANLDEGVREAVDAISDTLTIVSEEVAIEKRKHHPTASRRTARIDPTLAAKMQILHAGSFTKSVIEALHSVITLLALRGTHFRMLEPKHIGRKAFGELLRRIAIVQEEQSDPYYVDWLRGAFAEWLSSGEVLDRHRDPFVWSRLLLGSRKHLVGGSQGSFMRSQLSVLLSMWHDAVTEAYHSKKAREILIRLDVVKPKF